MIWREAVKFNPPPPSLRYQRQMGIYIRAEISNIKQHYTAISLSIYSMEAAEKL